MTVAQRKEFIETHERRTAWKEFSGFCWQLSGDAVLMPYKDGEPDWENATRDNLEHVNHWSDFTNEDIPRLSVLTDSFKRFIGKGDDVSVLTHWCNGTPTIQQIDGEPCVRAVDLIMEAIADDLPLDDTAGLPVPDPQPAPPPKQPDAPTPEPERLTSFNARDLMTMEFDPVRYVVPGYIAEGCTILAGASKLGKSWLVLQAALAVARGSTCLGGTCSQGDVLYLALEDNARRLKDRLRKQNPAMGIMGQTMPACLQFETEWPRADQGGLQKIIDWLSDRPNAKMVIIDVLKMFRANRKGNKNPYDLDYEDIGPLSKIAAAFHVAIVVVHHTNKGALSSDPFDRVNGTGGISGAADTTLIMARNDEGLVELYGRGREIEEIETAINFVKETCTWSVRGNAHEVSMSDTAASILRAMQELGEPAGPAAIAKAAGVKVADVDQHLPRLAKDGKVAKEGRGKWVAEDNLTPSDNPHKNRQIHKIHEDPANDNNPHEESNLTNLTNLMGGECEHKIDQQGRAA